jgi:hypothetical protein
MSTDHPKVGQTQSKRVVSTNSTDERITSGLPVIECYWKRADSPLYQMTAASASHASPDYIALLRRKAQSECLDLVRVQIEGNRIPLAV